MNQWPAGHSSVRPTNSSGQPTKIFNTTSVVIRPSRANPDVKTELFSGAERFLDDVLACLIDIHSRFYDYVLSYFGGSSLNEEFPHGVVIPCMETGHEGGMKKISAPVGRMKSVEGSEEMASMAGAVPAVEQREEYDPLATPDVDK
ncbi:unnamed protein product [Camellia sinensis]